jgi:hypothetical protein
MEYHNRTPFPSLAFESIDAQGVAFRVVVLRMTFDILADGHLAFSEKQSPLVMVDKFYREINKSSIEQESDLAPYKPRCDVIVLGDAVAPVGRPVRRFEAGIRISRQGACILDKRVAITGQRCWRKRFLLGWKLTRPEPVTSLPLRYEYAYGGECRINHDDADAKRVGKNYRLKPEQRATHPDGVEKAPVAHSCFSANTVGRGYTEKWYLRAKDLVRLPAPQIESISDPIKQFRKPYAPQGFGFLAKSSPSRIVFAGTMDETFIQSGKSLPEDFDFAYWNGAPADMQISWLEGNEEITLTNIGGISKLVLPEHKLCAVATFEDDRVAALDFNVDTLVINTDQKTVSLVYRLRLPPESQIQTLDVQQPSAKQHDILLEYAQDVTRKVLQYQESFHE